MDAHAVIEAESRELMRRRGLETRDDQIEHLIREVIADYQRRAATGAVPPLRDEDSAVATVAARIGGFGPLQELLDDPGIEEVWINSPPCQV